MYCLINDKLLGKNILIINSKMKYLLVSRTGHLNLLKFLRSSYKYIVSLFEKMIIYLKVPCISTFRNGK